MKWVEALKQIDKPQFTNREASGVIGFARALFRAYSKEPSVSLTPWDWYAFALPALGWGKPGDRFKVDTAHQLQPYTYTAQLRDSLQRMAGELDAAGVAFKLLVDPRGTDKGYRQLALDAWAAMKQLGAEGSKLPDALVETWTAQLGPQGAAAVATSASSAAAAAAAPKKTTTTPKPQEQPTLPGVDVTPPTTKKDDDTMHAQPVDMPTGGGGGGGVGLILFALLAFAGKRKRGRR